jgi:hypothetical protein
VEKNTTNFHPRDTDIINNSRSKQSMNMKVKVKVIHKLMTEKIRAAIMENEIFNKNNTTRVRRSTNREIKLLEIPQEILRLLPKMNGSSSEADTECIKMIHKIFRQLNLVKCDTYIPLIDQIIDEKKSPNAHKEIEEIQKHYILLLSINESEYFDGIVLTYSKKFTKRIIIGNDKCNGMCDLVIKSPKKINRIVLRINKENGFVLNDNTSENYNDNNDEFEYKFIYDCGRPYMAFPDFINRGGCEFCIEVECEDDSDVEMILQYNQVLVIDKYLKTLTCVFNIVPTNKLNVYVALSMFWYPHVLFDLHNRLLKTSYDKELRYIDKLIDYYGRQDIKNKINGIHTLIKITSIKYFNDGFNIYAKPLTNNEIIKLDKRYYDDFAFLEVNGEFSKLYDRIFTHDFLFLNNNLVAVNDRYRWEDNKTLYLENDPVLIDFYKESKESKEIGEIKLTYPIYALKGDMQEFGKNKGLVYELIDGGNLKLYKENDYLCINLNGLVSKVKITNNKKINENKTNSLDSYSKIFEGPYSKIYIEYEDKPPDTNWFMNGEKCYVFWNGLEYLTKPLFVNYTVPTKYLETTVEKLKEEGYIFEIL